jgi:hypothetical protein
MAKKLKTYETSLGFFDLAIAAPSMKAALAAWGADSNLFHQGAAKQSEDPDVVTATMAKPGVVLKRPVGSSVPSRSMPSYRRTWVTPAPDHLKPPASRPAANRKGHPRGRLTRRRSRRPLSPTNGSRSVANASGRGKMPPGSESANSGSRPSTRRNRRWTRLNGSMQRGLRPSKPRQRLSRTDRKPKMRAGTRRKSDWRPHSGAHADNWAISAGRACRALVAGPKVMRSRTLAKS